MSLKKCSRCKIEYPITNFYKNRAKPDGLQTDCKKCRTEATTLWARKHPEVALAIHYRYVKKHPEKTKQWSHNAYYKDHEATKAKRRIENQRYRVLWKKQVVEAYGGKCICCGESEIAFLTIEHLNHDGLKHRTAMGGWNRHYFDIIKQNFPKIYTILCMNCNWATRYKKVCPHITKSV